MLYHIKFPYLGLELSINRLAISYGRFNIYWYGITMVIAILSAFFVCMKKCKCYKIPQDKFSNIAVWSIFSGIIFARIYYVIFYPGNFYLNNPQKILMINEGGIAIYGAIIGGITAAFFLSNFYKVNFKNLLNVASYGLLLGQSIGRWGNFFNQEAFGTPTQFFLAMKSENTGNLAVHPCFFYESLWCILGLIFIETLSRREDFFKENSFLFYATWYSFGRFFIEGLRTDSLLIYTIRISQLLSGVIFLISSVAFLVKLNFKTNKGGKLPWKMKIKNK